MLNKLGLLKMIILIITKILEGEDEITNIRKLCNNYQHHILFIRSNIQVTDSISIKLFDVASRRIYEIKPIFGHQIYTFSHQI